jgi:hypothetical protein
MLESGTKNVPSAYDGALRFTYSNIVANDDKFNTFGLMGMVKKVLLFGKTEIEDIPRVVS